jgi:hypothetical protein
MQPSVTRSNDMCKRKDVYIPTKVRPHIEETKKIIEQTEPRDNTLMIAAWILTMAITALIGTLINTRP